MNVNKLQLPAKDNAVQLKINEIIDNLGGGGANTDLSNLTATGEAHFQEPLVSGTNIKTINNTSVLGSGNIDTSEIFVATYNTTTYQEVTDAYNAGKPVFLYRSSSLNRLYCLSCAVSSGNLTGYYFLNFGGTDNYYAIIWSDNTYTSGNSPILLNNSLSNISGTGRKLMDGQWVGKYLEVSTATSAASREHDLSSYLPSDSYSYEVFVRIVLNRNSASNLAVGTVASPLTNRTGDNNNFCLYAYTMANSQYSFQSGILPIGTGRKLYSQISTASGTVGIYLHGYRRIGTNT